jgi:hypothetical protein
MRYRAREIASAARPRKCNGDAAEVGDCNRLSRARSTRLRTGRVARIANVSIERHSRLSAARCFAHGCHAIATRLQAALFAKPMTTASRASRNPIKKLCGLRAAFQLENTDFFAIARRQTHGKNILQPSVGLRKRSAAPAASPSNHLQSM